ncbi:rhodanese-like domain-containing protein [Luteimonas kalidii]|uniref:Rhodanese-like domain-containing protein n=1 Tax=Luteimonas kalidii TaxID=3042025 RepID=A0ABT6JYE2_9GAMM|nr:rhodanese-like domain-containing protein [Luteimonas kalidii]MDH5835706.1 rhodanese-like domain-containing protein [Luteimonas kalidii]
MIGSRPRGMLAIAVAAWLSLGVAAPAIAQDSFGGNAPAQVRPQPVPDAYGQGGRTQDPPSGPGANAGMSRPAMAGPSNEAQDFGVAPTQQLRPTEQMHGPTPTSIPGGKVIDTRALSQLLQSRQGDVLLLHAYGGMRHLPGAVPVAPASQGGSFDDEVQRGFGQYLQQATGGDPSRMLVFYCAGVQCWGSYNASLRALKLGYRNVAWYRGGLEAWQQAGLPVQDGDGQQGAGQGQGR